MPVFLTLQQPHSEMAPSAVVKFLFAYWKSDVSQGPGKGWERHAELKFIGLPMSRIPGLGQCQSCVVARLLDSC